MNPKVRLFDVDPGPRELDEFLVGEAPSGTSDKRLKNVECTGAEKDLLMIPHQPSPRRIEPKRTEACHPDITTRHVPSTENSTLLTATKA